MLNPEKKITKDVILVVDDQPTNIKVIASILGQKYSLSFANNGMNALKILEKSLPDLILLDIMMPEMDGFEVCKRIKENENTREIPIIFLTAKTDIADVIKGFNLGAVDYIIKPFNPVEMEVRVKNHLNLYHSHKEIEQVNKEKDKFFSIIAHDLRSPFNAIVGFSQLLLEQVKDRDFDGIEQYAGIILRSAELALGLQNNLMEWAQSQTGRIEFNPILFELDKLINEIALLFTDIANQKSITLNMELVQSTSIFADKAMIGTVLRNLISNSIKYTKPGGTITITTTASEQDVIISVSDTGIGIPKIAIDNLFRIDKNQSTPGTQDELGTGLGLILCKEFIEKHDGQIEVESEINKGTTFLVILPLKI
ncbi:MAG: hybrid sensor histidine kinase/response regulator [Bacteroidales bacterium]